jgi:hypothetical protein
MSTNATVAEPGNVSEIQSLTERVQRLSTSVDGANRLLIWALVVAAIAAIFVGLATYAVIARGKRLADAQILLSAAKDRQLVSDLSANGVEIGKAKDDAAKAGQKASEAELRAADANRIAEELHQQSLGLEAKLGEEQATRLELEKSLAPRRLPYIFNRGVENIAPLKPFAGMQVTFEVAPDLEAQRAAGSMASAISQAGWQQIPGKTRADLLDGVFIESYAPLGGTNSDMQKDMADLDKGLNAARALRDLLISTGWLQVTAALAVYPPEALAPNTIRIKVGFKPSPYFEPPEVKAAMERAKQMEEEMRRRFNLPPR